MSLSYVEALNLASKINSQLSAADERFNHAVKLDHDDGSTFFWNGAFYQWLDDNYIAIFTEHHSFHVYHIDDISCYYVKNVESEFPNRVDF
jgi:hypothetical protein